jgi:hypothetical protein
MTSGTALASTTEPMVIDARGWKRLRLRTSSVRGAAVVYAWIRETNARQWWYAWSRASATNRGMLWLCSSSSAIVFVWRGRFDSISMALENDPFRWLVVVAVKSLLFALHLDLLYLHWLLEFLNLTCQLISLYCTYLIRSAPVQRSSSWSDRHAYMSLLTLRLARKRRTI